MRDGLLAGQPARSYRAARATRWAACFRARAAGARAPRAASDRGRTWAVHDTRNFPTDTKTSGSHAGRRSPANGLRQVAGPQGALHGRAVGADEHVDAAELAAPLGQRVINAFLRPRLEQRRRKGPRVRRIGEMGPENLH